jgi:hypothetical protein
VRGEETDEKYHRIAINQAENEGKTEKRIPRLMEAFTYSPKR